MPSRLVTLLRQRADSHYLLRVEESMLRFRMRLQGPSGSEDYRLRCAIGAAVFRAALERRKRDDRAALAAGRSW
jgi:hypothetical protein